MTTEFDLQQRKTEFLAKVSAMDLLCFRDTGVVSDLICKLEKWQMGDSECSHVGLCAFPHMIGRECKRCKTDGILNKEDCKHPCVLESTMSGKLNDGVYDLDGKTVFGAQARDLGELIDAYGKKNGANMGVAKLLDNPFSTTTDSEQRAALDQRLVELWTKKYKKVKYEYNLLYLQAAVFKPLRDLRAALGKSKRMFCSQMCANLLIDLGIISDAADGKLDGQVNVDSGNVLPTDLIGTDNEGDGKGLHVKLFDKVYWLKTTIINQ